MPINNKSIKLKSTRINETNTNKYGETFKIIKYNNKKDVIILFNNKYIMNVTYQQFKEGDCLSPYVKRTYNVGFIGEGKYKSSISGKQTIQYQHWRDMMKRCYSIADKSRLRTYENCTVCNEWHNFQNFGKWFDENYYKIDNEKMALDKDILHKGNKIYSPNTCMFVPHRINVLFTKNDINRGNLPIGVKSEDDNILACCRVISNKNSKQIKLGYFNTSQEAFNAYKQFKENYIKQVADEYKDKIPIKLYDAMYKYEVEITD